MPTTLYADSPRPAHRPRRTLAVALAVGVLLAAGCSSGKKAAGPTSTKPSKPTTTVPLVHKGAAPDPTVPKGVPIAPLTGLAIHPQLAVFRPALAVKVDNLDAPHESARPQAGIADADIVFEEIVEGNITRLVAVFQSAIPARIGPVRSARTTDPILLSQLDRPLFAWSGGNGYVVGAVHASPLRDFGEDAFPSAYGRDHSRRAPHNLFLTPGLIYDHAPADAKAPRPLFSYRATGEKLSKLARATKGVRITFGGGAASPTVEYQYDPHVDGWRRSQNGTTHVDDQGKIVAPRNVLIVFTNYVQSPADRKSPEAASVGSGTVWLLSKGEVVAGTWTRATPESHYVLKDQKGGLIKLTPGQTWVELPRPGGATLLD